MADETAATETGAPQASHEIPDSENNGAKRKKLLRILAIVVVAVAILWALWYFLTQAGRVHTDNAYVGADSAQVTALVPGPVKEVRVAGTQAVKKGDILVILDDADQRIALADAEAALRLARQHYSQADATADAARARVAARGADIAQAKARLRDANATVERARADFYPNISLSALVGLQSLGLSNLFKSGSEYGNGGAAISLPIFEGGRLQGRYRGSRADYDAAVATYDRTLIGALRDVADIVASRAATARQLAGRREALTAAAEASKLAGLRYRAGLSNQIVQLTAEDSMVALDRAVADLEARQLSLDIALIRALGGGYMARNSTGDE